MTSISCIRYAVFAGGGINGAVTFGSWLFMERLFAIAGMSMHDRMLGAAGTSMGSLLALCVLIGVPLLSVFAKLSTIARSMKDKEVSLKNAFLMSGVCDLDDVRKVLSDLLIGKGLPETLTFGELKVCTGRELVIVVNEVRTASLVILSASAHPDANVIDAIIASMSLPIIFKPVTIRGVFPSLYFSDGGLLLNFPWDIFPSLESVGFWLTEIQTPFKTLQECDALFPGASVPSLHDVALSLIRNVTRQICIYDQKRFLCGDKTLCQHIIALYTDTSGLDFACVDDEFISNNVCKGILLTFLHYLCIEQASEGTKWEDCVTALASFYKSQTLLK